MRRPVLLFCGIFLSSFSHAANWGGALEGLGDSLESTGRMMQQQMLLEQQQERAIELQHKLDMQRLEREHQMRLEYQRQQAIRDEQEAKQRQEEARQREQIQAENRRQEELERKRAAIAQVEQAHPGWGQIVKSSGFKEWRDKQPESVQRLGESESAGDAILMLDLYKRDTAKPVVQAKKKKIEKSRKAEKAPTF